MLLDGKGVPCVYCDGQGVQGGESEEEQEPCEECFGHGRWNTFRTAAEVSEARKEDREDLDWTIELIYATREHPLTPNQLLEQPARWCAAYRFLRPYLFGGEFEERRDALREKSGENP